MGFDFKIDEVIDVAHLKEAIVEIKKIGNEFETTKGKYASLAKELAGGIKIKFDGIQEFNAKQEKQTETAKELIKTQNQLADLQEKYKEVLKQVNQQMKENVQSALMEAKANKENAAAALQVEKANTERLRQEKLLNQQSKTRVVTEEEVTKALNTQVKSINQAKEQNAILRRAVNDVIGVDAKAVQSRQRLNSKIAENTKFIEKNTDAYTKQKMGIGGYSDAIQNAFNKMGLGNSTISRLVTSFSGLGKASEASTGGIENSSKALNGFKIGILATVAVIATLAAGVYKLGKAVIDTFTPFEYSVSKLAAILQTTPKGITDLTDNARALGAATKYTASEVVGLQTELAKLGFQKQEILDSTQAVLYFAQAVGTDLSSAAALAGATLRSFNADTKETERYVSVMAIATVKSALDFSKLQTSMPIVGSAAKAMGFEIEDTASLLGILSGAGLDASMSATALRNIFLNLADEGGALSKAMGGNINSLDAFVEGLQRVKDSGADLGEVLALTDKRSVVAFQNLLSNKDALKELRNSLSDVGQAMKVMANTMEDNLQGSTTRLKSAWEEFLISMNDVIPFANIKKAFTDMATSVLTSINNMLNSTRSATEAYDEQFKKVSSLSISTKKLTERYEELTGKAKLNSEEQTELNGIMSAIAGTIPGVVTKFDEYGNALKLNIKAAREWVDAQVALLEYQNSDAIDKTTKSIEKEKESHERLGKEVEKQKKILEDTKKVLDSTVDSSGLLGKQQKRLEKILLETTAAYSESGDKIKNLENRLKGLDGTTVKSSLMRAELNSKDSQQLDQWISQNENATDKVTKEYVDMANDIKNLRFEKYKKELQDYNRKETIAWLSDSKNTNKELREMMQDRLKDMKKILSKDELKELERQSKERIKIQQQLQESQTNLMNKGLAKELAKIRDNYDKKIKEIKGYSENEKNLRISLAEQMEQDLNKATTNFVLNQEKKENENKLILIKEGSDEELRIRENLLDIQEMQEINSGEDILIVQKKYGNLRLKLQQDFASKRLTQIQKEYSDRAAFQSVDMQNELEELSKQYAKGNKTREQYEKEATEITNKYAISSANMAIDLLEKQLEQERELLSPEDREALERKLTEAKLALSEEETKQRIANNEKIVESEQKKMQKVQEAIQQAAELLNSFADLGSTLYDRRIEKVEEESEVNQQAHDEEIERIERLEETGAISTEEAEARKRAAEDRTAQKEAELAKKKGELLTRQAKMEKANSIAQIILSTAAGIMKVWGQLGAFGAPMAAIVGIMGAIQLATAIAQPIPKYAKGVDNHPGGLAVVGDGGKNEAVFTPLGQSFISPAVPTLVDLPKGSQVFPDAAKLSAEDFKGMRSDLSIAMALERTGQTVIVNSDFSRLERGIGQLDKRMVQIMKQQERSAYMNYHNSNRPSRI